MIVAYRTKIKVYYDSECWCPRKEEDSWWES